ncbi:MAG: hypothetical protein M1442_04605 [Candidatus Thermoplasmatota archaeon]|jgi:hypothetical protein|nr:hypothetical protein [Candidatus Thermoplasmatota archaeon]
MAEKKTESEPAVTLMTADEFARKYPVSKRAGGRKKNERNEQCIELVQRYLTEKKTGYIVISGDPFFGSGVVMSLRKQIKDTSRVVTHWFDTKDKSVKDEVSKFTKQQARYLVQIEIV